ncbi:MAG: HYR domain-containing protein [Planctomycetes bacterium]|nr:HYR domain-containing protein [Planctomycetota bacterium]
MRTGIGSAIVLVFGLGAVPASSQTIRCVNSTDPSCTVTYPTIQDAVNASMPGDTILVGPGTYGPLIIVDRSLTISGAASGTSGCDPSRPVFMGESILNDPQGGFQINADNVTIDGFVIQDADGSLAGGQGSGIAVSPTVSGTHIVNCVFTNNSVGLTVESNGSVTTVVANNKFDSNNLPAPTNTGIGISSISGVPNLNVDGNCFVNNAVASIFLQGTGGTLQANITIQDNTADNAIILVNASNVIVTRNRVDHSPSDGLVLDAVTTADINCNSFVFAASVGIRLFRFYNVQPNASVAVHLNNIENNVAGLSISLGSYANPPLDATNNWWGDATGPFHAVSNPGGLGNSVSDNVTFAPFRSTPTLTVVCPSDMSVECASPAGTMVSFTAPVSSACDPAPIVSCVPASGSVFPPGGTDVACSARDISNATARCTFVVSVVDTTPPMVSCPADITVNCSGPGGAVVNFTATANDLCDPAPSVTCVPPSGSVFPVASTTVQCTGSDAIGNSSSCSFHVNVLDTVVPQITTQPISQTVSEGSSVTFTVVATGGALNYGWRRNGNPIPTANASSFTIRPVSAGDMDSYDVVVSNACGTAVSNSVTLTVTPVMLQGTVALGDASDPNNPPGAPRNDPREVAITTAGGMPKAFIADFQHGGISVLDLSVVPATFQSFLPAPAGFSSALAVSAKDDSVGVTYYDPDNGSQAVVYSATSLGIVSSFRISPASSASLPNSIAIVDGSVLVVADPVRQTVQGWFYSGPNAGSATGPAIVTSNPANRFGPGYSPTVVKAITRGSNRFAIVLERDSERIEVFPIRANGSLAPTTRRFSTGQLPEAIAVEATSRFAFITNSGNDTISVIGPGVPAQTFLTSGVSTPVGMALSVDEFGTLHLYVASRGEQTIEHFCGPLGTVPTFFSALTVGRGSLSIASQPGLPVGNPPTAGDRIIISSLVTDSVSDVGR